MGTSTTHIDDDFVLNAQSMQFRYQTRSCINIYYSITKISHQILE